MTKKVRPWNHGTTTGYYNKKCRCPECIKAYQDHLQRDRETWHAKKEVDADKRKAYADKNKKRLAKYRKKYQKEHAIEIKAKRHEYYLENKDEISRKAKERRKTDKDKRSKYNKKYHKKHKEELNAYSREYYKENAESQRQYAKDYRNSHDRDERNRKQREYYAANQDYLREYAIEKYAKNAEVNREKSRNRRKTHPRQDTQNQRIAKSLRSGLKHAIKENAKTGSAVRDLGLSIEEFKKYIATMFTEGMSWSNWGNGKDKWNIDHIRPLGTFDLSKRGQVLKAVHYTNLRPLWHIDNLHRPKDGRDIPNLVTPKKKKSKKKS